MELIEKLLYAASDIWKKYNNHPFVKGMENGTLDIERFRYYIIQDYHYLFGYAKVFGIGAAKSESVETMHLFSDYIGTLTENEMDIHRGYMERLSIAEEELYTVKPAHENISYTSYMLRTAYEEGEAEILTSVLSCAYSYEVISENMLRNNPECINHEFYGEWIKNYSGQEYINANRRLIALLDRLTANYSEKQINHLCDIFRTCSQYELDFWEMSWNMKTTGIA